MDPSQRLVERVLPGWLQICAARGRYPQPVSRAELFRFQTFVALWLASYNNGRSHQVTGSSPTATASAPPPDNTTNTARTHGLLGTIETLDAQMDGYEISELLDLALSRIPLQVLHSRADEIQSGPEALPCFEDALAQATVQWFKREFYHWVDPIKCPTCQGATTMQEMVPPDAEDINGKAGRVELHVCNDRACGGRFRFPRYNDLATLLRSRTGRCGEWANTFTLVLRAIGLRARYVWNAEDHVWNEYFSPTQQRWIHMDSCEAARDEPLLYDKGWGKKMSYILAFSTDGAEDVTRGYVRDWDETLRRRNRGSEEDLAKALRAVTTRRRLGLAPDVLARLEAEDKSQSAWLENARAREENVSPAEEHGRQSGTQEWKAARGETGEAGDGAGDGDGDGDST